jgi:hypothetical protein
MPGLSKRRARDATYLEAQQNVVFRYRSTQYYSAGLGHDGDDRLRVAKTRHQAVDPDDFLDAEVHDRRFNAHIFNSTS